jgi:hypothetical protein
MLEIFCLCAVNLIHNQFQFKKSLNHFNKYLIIIFVLMKIFQFFVLIFNKNILFSFNYLYLVQNLLERLLYIYIYLFLIHIASFLLFTMNILYLFKIIS